MRIRLILSLVVAAVLLGNAWVSAADPTKPRRKPTSIFDLEADGPAPTPSPAPTPAVSNPLPEAQPPKPPEPPKVADPIKPPDSPKPPEPVVLKVERPVYVPRAAAPAVDPNDARLPVPARVDQDRMALLTREIFQREYQSRNSLQRTELVTKLLRQGDSLKADALGRYVSYHEALEVATNGGDCEGAMTAIDRLTPEYQVNATDLRLEALGRLAASPNTAPPSARAVVTAAMALSEQTLARDEYDRALKAMTIAETASKIAKDSAGQKIVAARVAEVRNIHTEHLKLRSAHEKLRDNPQDSLAFLAIGRFLCFVRGDWEGGLPYLAYGSDAKLKALAEMDVLAPSGITPQEQIKIGNSWWDLGEGKQGADKNAPRARAAHWYARALPKLSTPEKPAIEKRLAELAPALASGQTVPHLVIEALIEGDSTLHITAQGLYWTTANQSKPGLFEASDEPTYVNGIPWKPKWGKQGDRGADACEPFPLKVEGELNLQVELLACGIKPGGTTIDKRDPIRWEKGSSEFTIAFADHQAGARWYRIKVSQK